MTKFPKPGKQILRPLNRVQQRAIFKTLMANDYVLIKGYPGSGKTTAIVALIRLIVALGKTVLLTSYTHAAVDNVLVIDKLFSHYLSYFQHLEFNYIG